MAREMTFDAFLSDVSKTINHQNFVLRTSIKEHDATLYKADEFLTSQGHNVYDVTTSVLDMMDLTPIKGKKCARTVVSILKAIRDCADKWIKTLEEA